MVGLNSWGSEAASFAHTHAPSALKGPPFDLVVYTVVEEVGEGWLQKHTVVAQEAVGHSSCYHNELATFVDRTLPVGIDGAAVVLVVAGTACNNLEGIEPLAEVDIHMDIVVKGACSVETAPSVAAADTASDIDPWLKDRTAEDTHAEELAEQGELAAVVVELDVGRAADIADTEVLILV